MLGGSGRGVWPRGAGTLHRLRLRRVILSDPETPATGREEFPGSTIARIPRDRVGKVDPAPEAERRVGLRWRWRSLRVAFDRSGLVSLE
jgi:hypothetical protein